jgi:hypothetical protein
VDAHLITVLETDLIRRFPSEKVQILHTIQEILTKGYSTEPLYMQGKNELFNAFSKNDPDLATKLADLDKNYPRSLDVILCKEILTKRETLTLEKETLEKNIKDLEEIKKNLPALPPVGTREYFVEFKRRSEEDTKLNNIHLSLFDWGDKNKALDEEIAKLKNAGGNP